MSPDTAIRVDHLSKLYHIGRAQQRHAITSTALSAGLRDALSLVFRRQELRIGSQASLPPDSRLLPLGTRTGVII